MKANTLRTDFTKGPLLRQLIVFSLPFMAANLLQSLYNIIDMIVVGQFVGSIGLSAVSIGGQITMFLTCLCTGFSTGAQILISQLAGRHEEKKLSCAIGTIFTTMLVIGIVITILGVVCVPLLIKLLNTPAEAASQACTYLYICVGGIIATFGYNTVSAILRGMGDSKRPLLFVAIASVTNLILDILFVAFFSWGAGGAALATIIGQAISFIFALVYLIHRKEAFCFDFQLQSFRIDPTLLKVLIKLGLPMTLQWTGVAGSFMVISSMVNTYGLAASAIAGIGSKLTSILNIVAGSIQTACAGMVGQNISIGENERVKRIVIYGMLVCTVFGLILCGVFLAFPTAVIRIFSSDADVLALSRLYMNSSVAGFMASFLMAATNGMIQGVGAMTFNFIVSIVDSVVARIGLSFLLGQVLDFGLAGFWWGGSLAGYITVGAGLVFFCTGRWKHYNLLHDLDQRKPSPE